MRQHADPVRERMRAVRFEVERAGVLSEIVGRVVEPPADVLGCDADVHLGIVVVTRPAGKKGVVGPRFPGQTVRRAPGVAGEGDGLQLAARVDDEFHRRAEDAGIPAFGRVVCGAELRGRLVFAE